jgi:hypothetical protein
MSDDDDLRYRLEVLKEQLEAGKIKVAAHLADGLSASLSAVRYGSDGKIDLSTVDGRIRAVALAMTYFKQREDTKGALSLRDIQAAYFESIENNFGDLFENMRMVGATPHQYASVLSQNDENVDYLYPVIFKFMDALTGFWEGAAEAASYHLQDLEVIKGVFGGDLFPVENIASTCGLYLDTIVLTDPFMNSRALFSRWDKHTAVRFFIKNAMNVLSYKELALADVEPPIVAILPFESSLDDDHRAVVAEWAKSDALVHAGKLFGRPFGSMDELSDFCKTLRTPEQVVAELADSDRLLFDTEWADSKEKQIGRALQEFAAISGANDAGSLVVAQCFGRMMQAADLITKSRSLSGTPLIEAETSWKYFNWKLEYDAVSENDVPLHMVHGLQHAGHAKLEWLGDIPPAALIEMRKQGAAEEIRSVLSEGVAEIAEAQPTGFLRTADKIVGNIEMAFANHQDNLRQLRNKNMKFWGYDIGSLIVTGGIGVAAAITSMPALALGALAADQVLDPPKIRDLPGRVRDLSRERNAVKNSPMGLLFRHRKNK